MLIIRTLPSFPFYRGARLLLPLGIFCLCLLFACGPSASSSNSGQDSLPKEKVIRKETTTRGNITIGIDATMQPVLRQEVDAFLREHEDAHIDVWYKPEGELIADLLNDSIRLIFISRQLTQEERNVIWEAQTRPRTTKIGRDAVALVMHSENKYDSLTLDQLQRIMRGDIRSWQDLGDGPEGEISIVFDDASSSTVRLVQERFLKEGDSLPVNAYVAGSTEEVVKYVEQTPNAIGLIGGCFVSDRDQAQVRDYLSRIQLARLEAPDSSDIPGAFFRPYQNEVALGRYPLSRDIYAISREPYDGLGTGFVVFVAGELGQRILLKAGLTPAFMPPRLVILPPKDD